MTPRSKRYDDESDVDTPYIKRMSTPSKTAWDEEDNTPGKFSSRDVPTPGSKRREDDEDWSKRSSSRNRHYEKETPLPTPTYKKNSWMKNSR